MKTKNSYFSKALVLLMAVMMVFTMMPSGMWGGAETAWAAEGDGTPSVNDAKTATVNFTAQTAGAFLMAPQFNVSVSSNLAESYGYTDSVTDGVSALDVLVKAHEMIFGEAFTKDAANSMLTISDTGFISKIFDVETYASGFVLNGMFPHDGTKSEYGGYNGTTVITQKVVDGDSLDFFIYQDSSYYSDELVWFKQSETVVNEISIYKDVPVTLNLQGANYMGGYLYENKDAFHATGTEIESAQLALVDASTRTITDIAGKKTDENGNVTVSFENAGEHWITAYMPADDVEAGDNPTILQVLKVTVKEPNASISVPKDAEVKVIYKGYISYNFRRGEATDYVYYSDEGDLRKYYFDLSSPTNTGSGQSALFYCYRISGEDYVTNVGTIKPGENLTFSEDTLKPEGKSKKDIDRNRSNLSKHNVADIYININEKNHLKLSKPGDTYQLVPLRNWQIVESFSNTFFTEPDYNFTVLNESGEEDNSVVSVSADGVVTANGKGTAIVLVSYDAMYNNYVGESQGFIGAIWPENTGVFVVSVGDEEGTIDTNITLNAGKNTAKSKRSVDALDAEHDVIYYTGDSGEYTFKPEDRCKVYIANPTITNTMSFSGFTYVKENTDGSFTVPLLEGRNIIKISKGNLVEYQVVTAKQLKYTINNGEAVKAGDEISIKFDTVFHPSNKLAGIYNLNALLIYSDVDGYDGKFISGKGAQYDFADNENAQTIKYSSDKITTLPKNTLKVPEDYNADTFKLSDGYIYVAGFGDVPGNHRGITYEKGRDANLTAAAVAGYLGQLPDIEIPIVATTAELDSISLTTTDVKTTYYEGDAFDTTNLVVTATYEDGVTQTATNYTVTPKTLTTDTKEVTVTYRGKTAKIPVSVQAVNLTEIKVEAQPTKTTYTVGDVFNPNGIKITAKYDNESTKDITSKVTYSNTVFNTAGDEIEVLASYKEKDITKTTTVKVKVNPAQSGTTPTDTIKVIFTLLGDDEHGEPTESTGTHTLKSNNLQEWIPRTIVTLPKGSTVADLLEKALGTAGIPYTNPSGNYVDTIRGLGEFDNGNNSGWMFTYNGKHGNLGVAEQKLNTGDVIVFHYTDDWTKESDTMGWLGSGDTGQVNSVTSDTKAGTTTSPTEVKVTEKANADGTKSKVAEVKVSADNQKEILKQAKANKSKEIILNVSKTAAQDATKTDVTLDKSFIDSIVKDTEAKLTVKTPFGDKTYTQDELKAMSEAATGTTVTVAIEKAAEQPADDTDKAAKIAKAKSITAGMKLTARSSKTAKKNVKVVLKSDAKENASLQELKDLGFTVKYRFFRSTNKSASYKSALTKKTTTYTNTSGKKGTKYFYKVQVRVYDENGKLVATTALRQCKYATRTWSK